MEDGPKLLPQWLRGNSSALHHRGDASDASKRAKPLGTDSARQSSQADPWLSRSAAGAPGNGLSGLSGPRPQNDFGRVPERGSQTERSWKPRGENGYSLGSHGHRSSYVPAALKTGGRDDRDSISLKPGGGYGAGRSYGRHSAESEGGAAAAVGRLDRVQDSWPSARTLSTGSTGAGGVGGGGGGGGVAGGRGDEDTRSPVRGGLANGGAAGAAAASANASATAKASFDQEFPSLRPSGSPSSLASASTGGGPAASAPPLTSATASATASASSALLDTASSSTPYRQTFLSSRTSSNWTSKLAEAPPPAAPQPSANPVAPTSSFPTSASADDDSGAGGQPPPPATTPSPSPSPQPHAGAVAPTTPAPAVPAPVAPPRPAGVWGTATAVATVAAAAAADGGVGGGGGAGISGSSRARLDQLTLRQSKQLIPVISSGGVKSKSNAASGGMGTTGGMGGGSAGGGGAGGGAAGAAAGRLGGPGGGVPKPLGLPGGMLKMSSSKGGGGDVALASGTASGGPRALTSNTVLLSKKASLPLDRPLTLTRTSSASAAPVLAASSSAGNLASCAGAGGEEAGVRAPARPSTTPVAVSQPLQPQPRPAVSYGGAVIVEAHAEAQSPLAPPLSSNAVPEPGRAGSHPPGGGHLSLQVTEEEEAFLRSLGWTGFEEEGDEADVGLTEEEIAAFRAQQQQQQRQQATVVPAAAPTAAAAALATSGPAGQLMAVSSAATVAMPKPVPGRAACGRGKPLIVAASYGSEQISSSTDSDSESE